MAIYLTTGKPGSFKTASTIEKALKIINDGRVVYFCNFRGLKAQEYGLNEIEHFDQWEKIPDGAVLFVDEVQEFTRDVKTNAKTEELPEWMTKLEKHRHRGIDIYINTQHPMFIHTHIRRLLEKHWHLQRVQGLPFANLRMWQQVCNDPEDIRNATIKMGCTTQIYRPKKDVFKYYESTVLDTHKFQIPKKLITYSVLILAGLSLSIYLGKDFVGKYIGFGDKETATAQTSNSVAAQQKTENTKLGLQAPLTGADAEIQSLKDANQQLYIELQQLKNEMYATQIVEYDHTDPWAEMKYTYQATTQPIFSGCVQFQKSCTCYTQQATPIKATIAQCKQYMSGDRPFNPFLTFNQGTQNATNNYQGNNPLPSQQNTSQDSLTEYAKFKEYQRMQTEYQRSQPQQQGELSHGFG